ncbi:MAG TPA: TIGR03067 domain-containing protein [Gemmataceae bacterium]|jgi:uncharacterized protein (TIGR03067 family)|nr:TIGR03067 domain-containing protein [Gemmataceae bacterium]
MKRRILGFVAAGILIAAGPSSSNATKRDLEKMQGDWAAVSMVVDGVTLSDDEAQSIFRTVKGNRYTLYLFSKALIKGTFKIDASKKPKTMDVVAADGPEKGKTVPGIYELDGDRLKVCFAPAGQKRPKDFTAKEGSGHTLTVWEREKK